MIEAAPGCTRATTRKLDDRNLVAFVSPATVDVELARQLVTTTLPYDCVPAQVFALDELPITGRGKVDKRALLALVQRERGEFSR